MPRADADRRAWLWAGLLAAFAPASYALLAFVGNGEAGTYPVVVAPMIVLGVLATVAMAASGVVGGLGRGVIATAAVWMLTTAIVYAAFDPTCGFLISRAPRGVAALGAIDSSALVCGTGEPSRWNYAGWIVLCGILATLVAMVGGLVGIAGRWVRRQRGADGGSRAR